MAEIIGVIGAVAAITQITSQIFEITKALKELSNTSDDDLSQIQHSVRLTTLLVASTKALQNELNLAKTENLIPTDVLDMLAYDASQVLEFATRAHQLCEDLTGTNISFKKKLDWAMRHQRKTRKALASLKESKENLSLSLQQTCLHVAPDAFG